VLKVEGFSAGSAARYVRVESPEDVPPAAARWIDVAILDMNHGWPNLGHDSLVAALLAETEELARARRETGVEVRVLSFDVRRRGVLPDAPGQMPGQAPGQAPGEEGRFAIFVGTGGPGHIDPHENDGVAWYSQGVREDAGWEPRLFRLFDAILADRSAALLAVCHTFGILCRWSGVARPVLRGPEKGGKSSGVLENELTPEAARHPWFGRFARGGRRLRILDNRLFDLIPGPRPFPATVVPIGYETLGIGGPRGDSLTMMEFARDAGGAMPRVFGVNHHPEILDRASNLRILDDKLARGEVDAAWAAERREILTRSHPDEDSDKRLERTSLCSLYGPLRFHLYRQVRRRAEALGRDPALHEGDVLAAFDREAAYGG
jgi:hypothetical protein